MLHLKIAESIEYIFQDRLHEFYGMLAYHYNQGQDLEKAEEYMTKAGEEALNSSASSEALDYYQEALKLYLRKHGDNTDQLKIANYEKNIGLALYNKGSMREAVRYFDNVMSRWGAPLPKMNLFGIARLMWDMWIILKVIYLFSPNSKRTPGNRDIEIFDLYHKASLSLTLFDNFRVVQVIMCNLKRTTKFELTKIPRVSMYWSASAGIFSASGFLFRLSNRLLHYAHEVMDFEGPGSRMAYACMSTASTVCQGKWEKINHIDEDLVDQSLKMGDFYHSSLYLWFYGLVKGEQGKFDRMVMVFNKLYDIGETYGHHAEIILSYGIKSKYFVKARHAHEAVIAAEKGIAYCQDYGSEINQIMLLGSKIEAQLLAGNIEGAQESILLTSKMIKRQTLLIMPLYLAPYLTARFFVAIEQLKISIRSGESSDLSSFKKYAFKVGKEAVRNSRKYAPFRTNILRLMGEFHWVTGKPEKAIKWWKKAITEGERLCARPDLSRTYYEVGKRLLEPQSKYKELNGTNGKQFLDKARIMFQDMSMQWDLAEMDNTTVDY